MGSFRVASIGRLGRSRPVLTEAESLAAAMAVDRLSVGLDRQKELVRESLFRTGDGQRGRHSNRKGW